MAHELIKSPIARNGDRRELITSPDAEAPQRFNNVEGIPAACQPPKIEGGIPMDREDHNQILYITSNNLFELQSGNVPGFDPAVASAIGGYPQGAILADRAGGRFVISLIPENSNSDLSDRDAWGVFSVKPGEEGAKLEKDFSGLDNTPGIAVPPQRRLASAGCGTVLQAGALPDGSWYRLYTDGWCDMGGPIPDYSGSGISLMNISLPCALRDTEGSADIGSMEKVLFPSGEQTPGPSSTPRFGAAFYVSPSAQHDPTVIVTSSVSGMIRQKWRVFAQSTGPVVFRTGPISPSNTGSAVQELGECIIKAGKKYRFYLRGSSGSESSGDTYAPGACVAWKMPVAFSSDVTASFFCVRGPRPGYSQSGAAVGVRFNGGIAFVAGGGACMAQSGDAYTGYSGSGYSGGYLGSGLAAGYKGYNINGGQEDLYPTTRSQFNGGSVQVGGDIYALGGFGFCGNTIRNEDLESPALPEGWFPALAYVTETLW